MIPWHKANKPLPFSYTTIAINAINAIAINASPQNCFVNVKRSLKKIRCLVIY